MSVIKRWNEATSEWEVAVIGKQGATGPTGPTGPSGPAGDVASSSIWMTQGDLAVGTGIEQAQRLAVGSNTQSLVASTTASTGLTYAHRSASGGTVVPLSGRSYPRSWGGSSYTPPGSAGSTFGTPLQCVAGVTVSILAINVVTAQAGAISRYAVYGSDSSGLPQSGILLTGTFDMSTTGLKTVSSTFVCPSPFLWFFICPTANSATWAIYGYNNNTGPFFNNLTENITLDNNVASLSILADCSVAFPSSPVFSSASVDWGRQPAWRYQFG